MINFMLRPDSSVGRASAFEARYCLFKSGLHHTKDEKNGTSSYLVDACIKGLVLRRWSKSGKYLLNILKVLLVRHNNSTELMSASNKRH